MEKQTFLISIAGEMGNKIVSLLANLAENFDVRVTDVLRVETDVAFLVPMLKELEDQSPAKVAAAKKVAESRLDGQEMKKCQECGGMYVKGVGNYCSKRCYNVNYRKRNKAEKKPSKKGALPNQAKIDEKLNDELARIEAVVANAKLTAPSASGEHTVRNPGGPILARKL